MFDHPRLLIDFTIPENNNGVEVKTDCDLTIKTAQLEMLLRSKSVKAYRKNTGICAGILYKFQKNQISTSILNGILSLSQSSDISAELSESFLKL
ncbi:MAG: hypothetical protein Kow0098_19900 [Ignavibacteriaceae bacterium]